LRTWRTDADLVTRLRDGLRALPDSTPEAGPPEAARPSAAPDPPLAAIKEAFARVAAAGDDAAAYFYASLFLRRPGLRELVPPAVDGQRDPLLAALARIVQSRSTPEEMAAYLTQLGRDHRRLAVAAPSFWTAEVVEREERGRAITVLTVAPDQELRYQAGQHLMVQTPRWPRVRRPYSIACRPRDDGLIRLHVRAVPGGRVSSALAFHTQPGDELVLAAPLGTMTLQHAGDRDLLCVAGGTGLSPLKAITEQVIKESAAGNGRQVFLFYGARCREELYDLRDLRRLAAAYDGLRVIPVTSDDPAFDGMQGNVGRVAARYVPHRDCEAYLSGPPAMVSDTLRVLVKAGMPARRIHFDDALRESRGRAGSAT